MAKKIQARKRGKIVSPAMRRKKLLEKRHRVIERNGQRFASDPLLNAFRTIPLKGVRGQKVQRLVLATKILLGELNQVEYYRYA